MQVRRETGTDRSQRAGVIAMVKWKTVVARVVPAASLVALVVTAAASKKWS
jgi:hypothetical protein